MALDGIFLHSIIDELKSYLINSKVDKINQPEKDEIILTLRGNGVTKKLLISASSNYPRIHFTNINKANPLKAPMYCMVLRKYLLGGKIVNITQLNGDRIVIIQFENLDELGFNSEYSLIIEIMGRHSNITLVRARDGIIMDSIKHITPDINSIRSLYPGIKYEYPPKSNKLNPFDFSFDEFKTHIENRKLSNNSLMQIFNGVSLLLSNEIYHRLSTEEPETIESPSKLYSYIKDFFNEIINKNYNFVSYSEKDKLIDFYCISLKTFIDYKESTFSSPSELLESFYSEKDKLDRLYSKSSDLQKLLNNNIERCIKKIHILNKTLDECKEKEKLRIEGELLTANIYSLKKGDKKVTLLNYYSENLEEYIDINLDENKTPSENIQWYFKRYNKLKKSEESALEQLDNTEKEMEYLQSVLTNIRNCESYEEIEEIRKELVDTGYIRYRKDMKNNKIKPSKPLHFISTDGIHIYVGKNNYQNDFLTTKFADKNDLWLHTKNIPGSHVIIKSTKEIPETTLHEAAILAAYYSKGKDSSKVPVDYTAVKNVKKPSGSKPGMVIYYTNKTLYVTPYEINLQKVNE